MTSSWTLLVLSPLPHLGLVIWIASLGRQRPWAPGPLEQSSYELEGSLARGAATSVGRRLAPWLQPTRWLMLGGFVAAAYLRYVKR